MTIHYCYQCGNPLVWRLIDNRDREVCANCGWVHYMQLKIGAAVLIEKEDRLLLLQRNHEPWKGSWMIPAGYVEADEDPRDAAKREVEEETGLKVELSGLLKVYYFSDDPRGNGVSFVYKADRVSDKLRINHESTAARYFSWDEIPSNLTKGGHDKIILEWCLQAQQKDLSNNG